MSSDSSIKASGLDTAYVYCYLAGSPCWSACSMARWWPWTGIQGGSFGHLTVALPCCQCLGQQRTSRTAQTAHFAAPFSLSYPQSMGSCMDTVSRDHSREGLRCCHAQHHISYFQLPCTGASILCVKYLLYVHASIGTCSSI